MLRLNEMKEDIIRNIGTTKLKKIQPVMDVLQSNETNGKYTMCSVFTFVQYR